VVQLFPFHFERSLRSFFAGVGLVEELAAGVGLVADLVAGVGLVADLVAGVGLVADLVAGGAFTLEVKRSLPPFAGKLSDIAGVFASGDPHRSQSSCRAQTTRSVQHHSRRPPPWPFMIISKL